MDQVFNSRPGAYAGQMIVGGVEFPNVSFGTDSLVRLTNTGQWIGVDINEGVSGFPGPYPFDDSQAVFSNGIAFTPSTALDFSIRTPGSINPSLVPEPTSITLFCLFGLVAVTRRHRD